MSKRKINITINNEALERIQRASDIEKLLGNRTSAVSNLLERGGLILADKIEAQARKRGLSIPK